MLGSGSDSLALQLTAPDNGYVFFAHVSDNFIDLRPGTTREIRATDQTRMLRKEELKLGWG